jgi:hypothetical protein
MEIYIAIMTKEISVDSTIFRKWEKVQIITQTIWHLIMSVNT